MSSTIYNMHDPSLIDELTGSEPPTDTGGGAGLRRYLERLVKSFAAASLR